MLQAKDSDMPDAVHEAALQLITSWVAAIADRVNNPLAGTLATLSLIERQLHLAERGQGDLVFASESLERIKLRLTALSEYVQELKNFGHPDTFSPVPFALATAVGTVAIELESRGEMAGNLDLNLHAPTLFADYARFKVALKCLIQNGWDAAVRADSPRVRVSSAPVAGGVEIVVEDNGPGFSGASTTRAGEPFYSTKEAGTGLGLAIVRKFVTTHDGTLAIGTSPTLGGAAVRLFLPSKSPEVKS